jgi:hypothetical protein
VIGEGSSLAPRERIRENGVLAMNGFQYWRAIFEIGAKNA